MESIEEQNRTFIEFPSIDDSYYDFSAAEPVPSEYKYWSQSFISEEATDEDIRRYIPHSPAFQFLSDPQEDIYTLEDGEEICP